MLLASIRNTDAYYETAEKAHGKVEIRRFYLAKAGHRFNGAVEWQNLRNFVYCEKYTCDVINGSESMETRYDITSLRDIVACAQAIRGHWGIENNLHWHLDYSFMEDMNTTIDKNAFNNFSLINKMFLFLCKLAQPFMRNESIRMIRKEFSWDYEETLAEMLSYFDAEIILTALENKKK